LFNLRCSSKMVMALGHLDVRSPWQSASATSIEPLNELSLTNERESWSKHWNSCLQNDSHEIFITELEILIILQFHKSKRIKCSSVFKFWVHTDKMSIVFHFFMTIWMIPWDSESRALYTAHRHQSIQKFFLAESGWPKNGVDRLLFMKIRNHRRLIHELNQLCTYSLTHAEFWTLRDRKIWLNGPWFADGKHRKSFNSSDLYGNLLYLPSRSSNRKTWVWM
jgi:hypothetical protein